MAVTVVGDEQPSYLSEAWRRRDFVWYTAISNIRARHSNTFLGLAWWLLNPLILGGIYFVVFGIILGTRRGDPHYIGYILSGLFAFFFTRTVVNSGTQSMRTNSRLIATRRFPRMLLPATTVVEAGIEFAGSVVPLMLIIGVAGGVWPGPNTLMFFPILILHTMFNFGLTLIFTQLIVPIPDIGKMTSYMTRIWLYMSPVIFPIEDRLRELSEFWFKVLSVNPMVSILGIYRGALLDRPFPMYYWLIASAWAVGLLIVGVTTFRANEGKLVRYL